MIFEIFFGIALLVASVFTYKAQSGGDEGVRIQTSDAFKSFQRTYLIVYFLMMAGDWLQGPYVYGQ